MMKKTLLLISTLLLSTMAIAKPTNMIEWKVTAPESPRIVLGTDFPDIPEHGRGMIFSRGGVGKVVEVTYRNCITSGTTSLPSGKTLYFEFKKGSGCTIAISTTDNIAYINGYMLVANQ